MCIPKFTHIATVIPNLSLGCIKDIEREFEIFLNDNNPSVTYKVTYYMTKNNRGLGMIKINHFQWSIKMSWLRRLPSSKSTWAELDKAETKPHMYNPITTNWVDIKIAKTKITNPGWKDIYDSLLVCRRNLLGINPLEYLTIPVNGESKFTKNNTAIQQPRCKNLTINDILDEDVEVKKAEDYPLTQRPFVMKFQPLKMQLENLFSNLNMSVAGHVQSVLEILGLL